MGESCPAVCAVRFLHGRKGKFILYCFVPIRGGRTTPHGDHAGRCVSTGAGRCCAPVGRQRRISPAFGDERLLGFRELNKKEAPAFYASASCVMTSSMDIASPIFLIIGALVTLAPNFDNSDTDN